MSANTNLDEALGVLGDKLQSLQAMTLANQFLVETLRERETVLKALDEEAARAYMRKSARKKFGEDETQSDVLEVLEQVLAPRQSAQIIQFPGRATQSS